MEITLGENIPQSFYTKETYLNLMEAIFAEKKLDKVRFNKYAAWIEDTDFFNAPASTRFHGSYPHGLLEHHLDVYNEAVNLMELEKFEMVDPVSSALVMLTHDYCKIGLYEPYMRNVKNEKTGQWEQVQSYRYDKPQFPLGHGVTSMYLVSKFIPLNVEESLAIRWHMGEYNCCDNEMSDLQEARDRYPLVLLAQTADRFSITAY